MDYYGYRHHDIWQIIQIFDMDGAYIDDSCIFSDKERKEFYYTDKGIYYKNTDAVKNRNRSKRELMDYLIDEVSEIHDIPYFKFFMSTDLEHALHGKRNLSDTEKQQLADLFYEKYRDKTNDFINFLKSEVNCPAKKHTWSYIRERGAHSLSRCTNLGIYFEKNPPGFD